MLKNEYTKHVGYKQFVFFFIKTNNIWKCENRRCHSEKRDLSFTTKTLNTHIISEINSDQMLIIS